MFYDRYAELCKKNNVSPSKAATLIGFNRSSVSMWKSQGYTPRREILVKIANYFNVSVDYLLGEPEGAEEDDALKFALWGGDAEIVDSDMLEDVRDFAKMLAEKKKRKMRNDNDKKPD